MHVVHAPSAMTWGSGRTAVGWMLAVLWSCLFLGGCLVREVQGFHACHVGRSLPMVPASIMRRPFHTVTSPTTAIIDSGHRSVVSWHLPSRRDQLSHRLFGIPRLFRWLVTLYPDVLESAHLVNFRPKQEKMSLSQNFGPKGKSAKTKVDNFYLDMNGIIHTCTHGNSDGLVPYNERTMFGSIFTYTDNLFKYVKPQNKLVLAIDGVAPRAKRNQQRARRFRAATERDEQIRAFIEAEGRIPTAADAFDSSCITPGTAFMHRLSIAFRSWIEYKRKTDNFWRQSPATIVFSGADVPGEGEHKIMDLIRSDRLASSDSKQDLVHCMYGQDADLIMLSLVTHERFLLLREKMVYGKKSKNVSVADAPTSSKPLRPGFRASGFEILDISSVRTMLESYFESVKGYFNVSEPVMRKVRNKGSKAKDKNAPNSVFFEKVKSAYVHPGWLEKVPASERGGSKVADIVFDFERIVDDFILLSFLVGNDFIPSIPHFDIADGSMEMIMDTYHNLLPTLGGYVTDKGSIHLNRLELIFAELARREPLYFQHRAIHEEIPEFETETYKTYYYLVRCMHHFSAARLTDVFYRANLILAMRTKSL
jgi:5'-3' exoribonuclease 1